MRTKREITSIRLGFIGAGAIAQRRHLPEAADHPNAVIAAIADPAEARVREVSERYRATPYTDCRGMLETERLDAVIVAGPNASHATMTLDALGAGLHVLCEKPMATTLDDARAMTAAAARHKRMLMVAMNQRFMPQHVKAREMIASGRLGRVLSFHSVFAHAGPEAWSVDGSDSWFLRKADAGLGVLGDLGIHKVDLIRFLLGQEFDRVGAEIATHDKKLPDGELISLEDDAHLLLRTDGGAGGTIHASWTRYGGEDNHTLICCEHGVIGIGLHPPDHLVVDWRHGDREAHRLAGVGADGWPRRSGVMDAFLDAIAHRRRAPVSGEDGVRSLEVVLAGLRSAREGKSLQIQSPSRRH